jgi:hypothetical protein
MSFFDKKFQKEDLFLYLVTLGLIIFFGIYMIQNRDLLMGTIQFSSQRVPESQAWLFELQKVKYDFANKVLAVNTMRHNMSFMVGVVLCLLGTMVVVRRLRESIEASGGDGNQTFTLKTSSPGIFLALIGFLLMAFPTIFPDKYGITDPATTITLPNTQQQPQQEGDSIAFDTTRVREAIVAK